MRRLEVLKKGITEKAIPILIEMAFKIQKTKCV